MAKTKETPWADRKLMYKDGNVDVFRKFNWETWKRMTEGERAMWTELSEATPAPISKEVIEFNKKVSKKLDEVEVSVDKNEHSSPVHKFDPDDYDIETIRAVLKERGIKFAYNSKLETLQKKLADADNPE